MGIKRKENVVEEPPTKFAKGSDEAPEADEAVARSVAGNKVRESVLFRPAYTCGVVTEAIPFAHCKLGDANFVTVSVGRGFQVYETDKLQLAYKGQMLNSPVRAVLSVGEVTVCAMKNEIVCYSKTEEVCRLRGHHQKIKMMQNFGSSYLVSASERNETFVWRFPKLRGLDCKQVESIEPQGNLGIERVRFFIFSV